MTMKQVLTRTPILNGQQRIIGYELGHGEGPSAVTDLLVHALQDEEDGAALGKNLFFIPVTPEFLCSDVVHQLAPRNTVFVLDNPGATQSSLAVYAAIRKNGFGICAAIDPAHEPDRQLLQLMTHVKFDAQKVRMERIPELSWTLRRYPPRQIATAVDGPELFDACSAFGIDTMQGSFHLRFDPKRPKGVSPAQANIFSLMMLIRQDADMRQIEEVLKRNASIAYKLLCYINSAGFGLSCEIQSFRHAVTILGYRPLYRWLSLLMVTAQTGGAVPAQMQTAIVRARVAELLGSQYLPPAECETLFVAGLFSLLDVMSGVPMEELVEQIPLPEGVIDVLLKRPGPYGPFIELVTACEGDRARLAMLAEQMHLSAQDVNRAHLAALGWVQKLPL